MDKKRLTSENGKPIADNQNIQTAGVRGPAMLQDVWYLEKLAHFDREVIPERRIDRKSTRLNSSHKTESRMPSSA